MTLENQAILSNYEQLTALDAAGKVWLVKMSPLRKFS